MRKNILRDAVILVFASSCLFMAGWYTHRWQVHTKKERNDRRIKEGGHFFTSPLLDVELPEGVSIHREPLSFKYKVDDFVKAKTDGKTIQKVSVYFRDLADGPWFGINEHLEFNPASMMKVPVMIAWLKRAEKNPAVLKQTFLYNGSVDMSAPQHHKPRFTLKAGQRYPVEKLLEYMIRFSDNNATSLLYANLTPDELSSVLDGMDITNRPDDNNNSTTVHGYSGFFRILYNASFLSRDMSEKALELLSMEDFPQGISAGVPNGIRVAAKFGEFETGINNMEKQLHEFGIVYHPKGAYILGIMTKGNDFVKQAETIRDVSALVFHEIENGGVIGTQ